MSRSYARFAGLTAMLAAAGGCPVEREPAPIGEAPVPAEIAQPPGATARERCQAYYRDALRVEGETRAELRGELGDPLDLRVSTEPNRHVRDATDTISVLSFPELEAQIRTAQGTDHLEQIVVQGNRHLRFGAPAIGSARAELIELFGEPDRREAERLEYFCAPEPMPDIPVSFTIREGEIREVTFHRYVD